ncbi:MAG: T9SS type A sorting domain-containing protein [bacterium]|nr:T9SS type A sorting domain-containing protein [bacterium]
MRFTPTQKGVCRVKGLKVFSRVFVNAHNQKCSAYVKDDSSDCPGATRTSTTYTPSVRAWDRVDFSTPVDYTSDFWLAIYLPEVITPTDSVALVTDNSLDYPGKVKALGVESGSGWQAPPTQAGDFMIRAIVDYTGVEETSSNPTLALNQNYPNPVIKNTNISYTLPAETKVKLQVYNTSGRLVKTLLNEIQSTGAKEIIWDKKDMNNMSVSSGIYFYRLTAGSKTITKTMIVL